MPIARDLLTNIISQIIKITIQYNYRYDFIVYIILFIIHILMIYFIEPYTKTKISYNKVHSSNSFRWKDKNFNLEIAYDWPTDIFANEDEKEVYEMFLDFKILIDGYKELRGAE